jgi:hypothetical protein
MKIPRSRKGAMPKICNTAPCLVMAKCGSLAAGAHHTLRSFESGAADFDGRGHGCIRVAAVGGFLSCGCSFDKAEFRGYPAGERLSGMRCGPQS